MGERALAILAFTIAACGNGGATGSFDASTYGDGGLDGSSAVSCRSGPDGGRVLGTIPSDGGCAACEMPGWEGDDPACAAAYPDLPSGCRAYCQDGRCERLCEDECEVEAPDGGCTPGNLDCWYGHTPIVCDPTCGATGGCRGCVWAEECEAELGPTAICQRHCGTCCRYEDGAVDGGHPCLCI